VQKSYGSFEVDVLHFLKPAPGSRRQHIIYMRAFLPDWYVIRNHQLWKILRISCSFYYLVASSACFVHNLKIQVLAEREQKIQTEVKEIRKVFFCELCNKQYKLAMEFEAHLSSYDHNHRKVNILSNTNLALLLTWFRFGSVFLLLPNAKSLMLNMQRFKEMKEMHGSSSRDDRQKREQQRQERELAKFAQMYPFAC